MRTWLVLFGSLAAWAEPLRWTDLPPATAALLQRSGIDEASYDGWLVGRAEQNRTRLAAGSAEHITYYLLQTKELGGGPPLQPTAEAQKYVASLPNKDAFLRGAAGNGVFPAAVRDRMRLFWETPPTSPRHKVLRGMAERLGWPRNQVVETTFRFLARQASGTEPDGLYQERGFSADPYRPGMRSMEAGLTWLRTEGRDQWKTVLLAGPGAEFGSRFGLDDALPILSPQATALRGLLGTIPIDCVDIRTEVTESLAQGPCRPATLDLAGERLPANRYDLAVATNLLVYLDDAALGVAMANLARSLRPGGCLLHNDPRFAARLFGEAAGLPALHFSSIRLGERQGKEQLDRVVLHCREK